MEVLGLIHTWEMITLHIHILPEGVILGLDPVEMEYIIMVMEASVIMTGTGMLLEILLLEIFICISWLLLHHLLLLGVLLDQHRSFPLNM